MSQSSNSAMFRGSIEALGDGPDEATGAGAGWEEIVAAMGFSVFVEYSAGFGGR